ncbi:hypothetical protein [Cryobacterium luteum]|uniref:Uncharacterized protein n=1 Tax=Cryobacterium luteum TaxID=1424661 RepID=A0A1H8AR90_9MICO|nr:hypothetical protein [Cryobacterium luteum]TFB88606.1 hypothetical protein E3O10_12570 [Cryobacterium luteum]SEM73083.1 hypothetical protein SAMN05216281_101297 [Cryobacterium luteum]
MATIIETDDGGFIAGDPPETLPEGHHWCAYCAGSGLEYGDSGSVEICSGCHGACTEGCDKDTCDEHVHLKRHAPAGAEA